jgi:hypothetical protein
MVSHFDIATELTHLLFPDGLTYKLKGEFFITANGRKLIYDQPSLELNQVYLEFLLRTLTNLLEAYPTAVAMGGEAVPSLQFLHLDPTRPLYTILPQLLRDIELDTTARIGSQPARYFCRRCLARCGLHKILRPDKSRLKYYGCRLCHQSHDLFEGKVVLSLDSQMSADQDVSPAGVLRLNWLSQRRLCDFHEVEIGPVGEAELQAFIDQVDQDPNLIHQHRYQQMRCVVTQPSMPAHSLRRLRELFGQVEFLPAAKAAHSEFRPRKNFSEKLL